MQMTTLFGKYRGKVVDNLDPLMLGRLIILVPAVSEFPLSWAMPCVPYAGKDVGFFALPPMAANVWVEFEGGDPNYPPAVFGALMKYQPNRQCRLPR